MCYNMGDLRKPGDHNSIIDLKTLRAYTGNDRIIKYPLPLDFALPLFEWDVLFRKGQYAGLTRNMPLEEGAIFRKSGNFTWTVVKDTAIDNVRLHPGDLIRHEDSPADVLKKPPDNCRSSGSPERPLLSFIISNLVYLKI